MSKGPTKAQVALTEAQEWIDASKQEVAEREADLSKALAQLGMHETIYAVLEKALSRAPRKTAGKAAKKASKKASKSPRATALESQLKASVDERRQAKATDDCHYVYPADGPVNAGQLCGESLSNRVHDQLAGYVGYHKFEPTTL